MDRVWWKKRSARFHDRLLRRQRVSLFLMMSGGQGTLSGQSEGGAGTAPSGCGSAGAGSSGKAGEGTVAASAGAVVLTPASDGSSIGSRRPVPAFLCLVMI